MPTEGRYNIIEDLAATEKINPAYVSRFLRLAFLAPEIVGAILAGRQPAHLTMKALLEPFPADWREQRKHFFGDRQE